MKKSLRLIPIDVNQWGCFALYENGKYCALGFVGKALGFDDEALENMWSYSPLAEALGVEREALGPVHSTNDDYRDIEKRKEAIVAPMAAIGCVPVFSDET